MITATTSRIWIKPPIVVLVTIPRSHRIIKMTQIVHNIVFSFQFAVGAPPAGAFRRQPTAIRQIYFFLTLAIDKLLQELKRANLLPGIARLRFSQVLRCS
jgi:hypothetical protein